MLFSLRYPVNITFQGAAAKLRYSFLCIRCLVLAPFYSFLCPQLKIITKQLFASGSVNIGKYLPRLWLGEYYFANIYLAFGE